MDVTEFIVPIRIVLGVGFLIVLKKLAEEILSFL